MMVKLALGDQKPRVASGYRVGHRCYKGIYEKELIKKVNIYIFFI